MTDIPKQIDYWLKSAEQDFEVGKYLVGADKTRHGLFFIHLALEKILKGCFCKTQNKTPPKIHNLVRLYELAGFETDGKRQNTLAAINRFCLEGRYPEEQPAAPDKNEAMRYLQMAERIYQWFRQQL
jgi:HEPN domain-containing protein